MSTDCNAILSKILEQGMPCLNMLFLISANRGEAGIRRRFAPAKTSIGGASNRPARCIRGAIRALGHQKFGRGAHELGWTTQ